MSDFTKLPKCLYKTTIVIWTKYNPDGVELDDLTYDACVGDAFCSSSETEKVEDQSQFPDIEFFGMEEEDD